MAFSPFDPIVKLCLLGMEKLELGQWDDAERTYMQAWDEATDDFGKFLASYYLANINYRDKDEKLSWLNTALKFALKRQDIQAKSALAHLYESISAIHFELKNYRKANHFSKLAAYYRTCPFEQGPFYHGTRADLSVGDYLTAGYVSNYDKALRMNHIYFTASLDTAVLAALLSNGEGTERIYLVEPIGSFEADPNVTDRKFPGNPTRSYRSEKPLKVLGEVTDWKRPDADELVRYRNKLANNTGEIMN